MPKSTVTVLCTTFFSAMKVTAAVRQSQYYGMYYEYAERVANGVYLGPTPRARLQYAYTFLVIFLPGARSCLADPFPTGKASATCQK